MNRAGERITGYHEQELLGLDVARVVAPEHVARASAIPGPTPTNAALPVYELNVVDLASALEAVARQVAADAPVELTTEVMGIPCPMPAVVENNLLRIGQEAMTNAVRHSSARRVRTELRFEPEGLRLVVTDDGAGFDLDSLAHATSGRFGLLERDLLQLVSVDSLG